MMLEKMQKDTKDMENDFKEMRPDGLLEITDIFQCSALLLSPTMSIRNNGIKIMTLPQESNASSADSFNKNK
eukprot:8728175-Ditylum_brightwellii.AAC.1